MFIVIAENCIDYLVPIFIIVHYMMASKPPSESHSRLIFSRRSIGYWRLNFPLKPPARPGRELLFIFRRQDLHDIKMRGNFRQTIDCSRHAIHRTQEPELEDE
jgi:hypothetical protein